VARARGRRGGQAARLGEEGRRAHREEGPGTAALGACGHEAEEGEGERKERGREKKKEKEKKGKKK